MADEILEDVDAHLPPRTSDIGSDVQDRPEDLSAFRARRAQKRGAPRHDTIIQTRGFRKWDLCYQSTGKGCKRTIGRSRYAGPPNFQIMHFPKASANASVKVILCPMGGPIQPFRRSSFHPPTCRPHIHDRPQHGKDTESNHHRPHQSNTYETGRYEIHQIQDHPDDECG